MVIMCLQLDLTCAAFQLRTQEQSNNRKQQMNMKGDKTVFFNNVSVIKSKNVIDLSLR